jgi:hypothetical protein
VILRFTRLGDQFNALTLFQRTAEHGAQAATAERMLSAGAEAWREVGQLCVVLGGRGLWLCAQPSINRLW